MRLIGQLDSADDARLFSQYLFSRNIPSTIDEDDGQWDIWIVEEDQVDVAKEELESFRLNPQDEKYKAGAIAGQKVLKETKKQQRQQAARQVNMRRQWEPVHISQCPVTMLLIGVSVLVGLLSSNAVLDVGAKKETGPIPVLRFLDFEEFWRNPTSTLTEAALYSLNTQEPWRYITPIFIHYGFLHILFNLMWMKDLGPMIESKTNAFLYLFVVLIIALVSNMAEFVIGLDPTDKVSVIRGANFGGMSGVVFGLFGFIWLRGKFDAASGMYIPPRLLVFLGIFQLICFLGILGPIANWAHVFGFITGALIGMTISLITKARRRG